MSIINSGSFSKALWPGVNAWYGKAYDEYDTEYDKLFDKLSKRVMRIMATFGRNEKLEVN